jgi:hypothetical protein
MGGIISAPKPPAPPPPPPPPPTPPPAPVGPSETETTKEVKPGTGEERRRTARSRQSATLLGSTDSGKLGS